jgi:hypothetical protein
MRKAPPTFKQTDLTRACKGVLAAGLRPKRAEIDRDGKIVMVFEGGDEAPAQVNAFDQWKARRDGSSS